MNIVLPNPIEQYQYMLLTLAIASVIFCFYTNIPKAKNLVAVCMLITMTNFILGIMLNFFAIDPLLQPQMMDLALSPDLNHFLILAQVTLGLLAYLSLVTAFFV